MLDHLSIQCADVAASAAFYDAVLATSHLGILNSPDTHSAALQFLSSLHGRPDRDGED